MNSLQGSHAVEYLNHAYAQDGGELDLALTMGQSTVQTTHPGPSSIHGFVLLVQFPPGLAQMLMCSRLPRY